MSTICTQRTMLPIWDFNCPGSEALIVERALLKVAGIMDAYVNPATEIAYVEPDPAQTGVAQLITAIEHSGFHAGVPILRER